jgi:hypothetical protein
MLNLVPGRATVPPYAKASGNVSVAKMLHDGNPFA